MNDEKDVMVEAQATPESSPETKEQEATDSEVVKTPASDGKDYQALYENAREALRQEREKRREQVTRPVEPDYKPDDDIVADYNKVKANAYIARKLATDPAFKDLVPEIEDVMTRKGFSIEQAEMEVKATMLDKILAESSKGETKVNSQQQLKTNATPEPEVAKSTGNKYRDVMEGNDESEDARLIRNAIQKHGK